MNGAHVITLLPWIDVGAFQANWAIRIDTLSIVMMAVITGVSGLVHLYSWGYMSEDPHRSRFFAYLSLFTFAMLSLVVADNFIQLGRRGPRVLPADRFLVQEEGAERRVHQGLRNQPRG